MTRLNGMILMSSDEWHFRRLVNAMLGLAECVWVFDFGMYFVGRL